MGLTRRGHGESEKPETGYGSATLVEDLRQFLDRKSISRVSLVGHSMAGIEMTQFATLYPERVSKLVYLDAAYDLAGLPEILARAPISILSFSSKDKVLQALRKCCDDYRSDYTKVKAPTLAFYALHNIIHQFLPPDADEATRKRAQQFYEEYNRPWMREKVEKFRKSVPHARIVEMPDTDHYCFIQRQDEVVRAMRAFLLGK